MSRHLRRRGIRTDSHGNRIAVLRSHRPSHETAVLADPTASRVNNQSDYPSLLLSRRGVE